MPRFVYAFPAPVTARAEAVAVSHSTRKHVRSYSLYSKHLTEFGPVSNKHVHKYYAYCNSVTSLLIYVVFLKMEIIYFAISAPSFDKNNNHKSHTVSRSVIIFQAETTAPTVNKVVFFTFQLQSTITK